MMNGNLSSTGSVCHAARTFCWRRVFGGGKRSEGQVEGPPSFENKKQEDKSTTYINKQHTRSRQFCEVKKTLQSFFPLHIFSSFFVRRRALVKPIIVLAPLFPVCLSRLFNS
jgi:hypothetical protein